MGWAGRECRSAGRGWSRLLMLLRWEVEGRIVRTGWRARMMMRIGIPRRGAMGICSIRWAEAGLYCSAFALLTAMLILMPG